MSNPTSETALVPVEATSPLPVFRGQQMVEALTAYRDLQNALDKSMPEQVMNLDGKPFRKKGYWRAISVAFNLTVELVEERREMQGVFDDGRENFGYIVTYRAVAPNGRSEVGDGACFAVEKARRKGAANPWAELPKQASEHNVRSHAHTRAFNRAVSNLVGFGEVSAEEVERDDASEGQSAQSAPIEPCPPVQPPQRQSQRQPISEPQRKRMFAIAMSAGWSKDEYADHLSRQGITDDRDTPRSIYDGLCAEFQQGAGASM